MAPAWSFRPTTSAGPPPPPDPLTTGMILLLKGADSWIPGSGPTAGRVVSGLDLSGAGQDFTTDSGFEPLTSGVDIDGVACVTFGFNLGYYLIRAGALKDRDGVNMGYSPGDNQAKSIFVAMLPTTGVFSITGGPVFSLTDDIGPHFECLFDLEGNFFHPDGFYVWAKLWRNDATAILGPDTPGATYDGVPTLGEWRQTAFPDLAVAVNGEEIAITPSAIPGMIGSSPIPRSFVGNIDSGGFGLNFSGSIAEVRVYDYDVSTNPTARQAILQYFADTYPSIPVVVP